MITQINCCVVHWTSIGLFTRAPHVKHFGSLPSRKSDTSFVQVKKFTTPERVCCTNSYDTGPTVSGNRYLITSKCRFKRIISHDMNKLAQFISLLIDSDINRIQSKLAKIFYRIRNRACILMCVDSLEAGRPSIRS